MKCERGHAMVIREQFRFDHEPGDSARVTENLELFARMGFELGAEVTLWYCESCDLAVATFDHGDGSPITFEGRS